MTALAAAIGTLAALLHFAGALKSAPPLAGLPFDLTAAAALALLALLPAFLASRDWSLDRAIALPLAACGALWLWLVLAGAWSPAGAILRAKLPEAVLLGPAMLAVGMAVAGDARALRAAAGATLAIGAFVAAAVAWGLFTGGVVLGGAPGAQPDLVRVQYQIAGLAIASAAALAALRGIEAASWPRRGAWLALAAALAGSALLPGGRAALAALALALAAAPSVALWRSGRPGLALLWPLAVLGGAAAVLGVILADPTLSAGLRTVERLAEGDVAQASGRAQLWRAALDQGGTALPFGLGTGGFSMAAGFGERRGMYPHNHALEALAEGGLPGAALWLLAFGGGAVSAVALGARAPGWRAARVAALVLPMALSVMVSTDLGNRMAWFALGLTLGLGLHAEARDVRPLRQARA
jgi:O-antigen ligase